MGNELIVLPDVALPGGPATPSEDPLRPAKVSRSHLMMLSTSTFELQPGTPEEMLSQIEVYLEQAAATRGATSCIFVPAAGTQIDWNGAAWNMVEDRIRHADSPALQVQSSLPNNTCTISW